MSFSATWRMRARIWSWEKVPVSIAGELADGVVCSCAFAVQCARTRRVRIRIRFIRGFRGLEPSRFSLDVLAQTKISNRVSGERPQRSQSKPLMQFQHHDPNRRGGIVDQLLLAARGNP